MESHRRTLLKTLSWRAIAAVITAGLAFVATENLTASLALGSADTGVKFVLYYLHERAWARAKIGYLRSNTVENGPLRGPRSVAES